MVKLTKSIRYLPADHTTDRPILAIVSGAKRTLAIDAGNSPAHAEILLREMAHYRTPELSFIVLTHWHWDHVFGAGYMNRPIIAQVQTRQRLEELAGFAWTDEALDERVALGTEISFCAEMIKKEFTDRSQIHVALPDLLFEDKLCIDLGGVTCLIENVGGDHSPDCTVILVQEDKALFLGDCLAPNLYTGEWQYRPDVFLSLADKLESYEADIYVPSHGTPVGKEEFLQELGEMRQVALEVKETGGDYALAAKNLQTKLGRPWMEDDVDTLLCFIRGYGGLSQS